MLQKESRVINKGLEENNDWSLTLFSIHQNDL